MRQSKVTFAAEGSEMTQLPALALKNGKTPKTLKDTMQHLVKANKNRDFNEQELILGSG